LASFGDHIEMACRDPLNPPESFLYAEFPRTDDGRPGEDCPPLPAVARDCLQLTLDHLQLTRLPARAIDCLNVLSNLPKCLHEPHRMTLCSQRHGPQHITTRDVLVIASGDRSMQILPMPTNFHFTFYFLFTFFYLPP
jgi:hypothetical protein